MKLGNVTGDVYDRSIHKKLNSKREGIINGAAHGEDCAIFSVEHMKAAWDCAAPDDKMSVGESGKARIVTAQCQTPYTGERCGKYAVYAAVNQAAAFGASKVTGVLLNILLPAGGNEQELRSAVADAQEAAAGVKTAVADIKASVTPAVNEICVTATAVGMARGGRDGALHGAEAARGQIVMTKWAGLEGSAILANRFCDKLRRRYPSYLIEEAAAFDRFLTVVPEAAVAGKSGCSALCAAAEGGIFRALWTLAECAGVGLEIDLKKIPIRQETVEICNYLDLNPYELMANGSLLCLTEHAEALLKELHREQIPAAVIGSATANRDRVIINGEERRFLEPSKADEIYRVLI